MVFQERRFVTSGQSMEYRALPWTESSSAAVLLLSSVINWKVSKFCRKTLVTSSEVFERSALVESD